MSSVEVQASNDLHGTIRWLAPEHFAVGEAMTKPSTSDLWSLGCVLQELISGQWPFACVQNTQALSNHFRELALHPTSPAASDVTRLINQAPDSAPRALVQLMRACLQVDLKNRPRIDDVIAQLKVLSLQMVSDDYERYRSTAAAAAGSSAATAVAAPAPAFPHEPTFEQITAAARAHTVAAASLPLHLIGAEFASAAAPSRRRPAEDSAFSDDELDEPFLLVGSTLLEDSKRKQLHQREFVARNSRQRAMEQAEKQRREVRAEKEAQDAVRVEAQRRMDAATAEAHA